MVLGVASLNARKEIYACTDPHQSIQMADTGWSLLPSHRCPSRRGTSPSHLNNLRGCPGNDNLYLEAVGHGDFGRSSSPGGDGLSETCSDGGRCGLSDRSSTDEVSGFQPGYHGKVSGLENRGGARWCCLVKFLQLVLVLLLVYALYSLFLLRDPLRLAKKRPFYLPESLKGNSRRPLGNSVDYESSDFQLDNKIVRGRPHWARVQYAPHSLCVAGASAVPKLVLLVHSRPSNLIQRNLIRETWGSVKTLESGDHVELLFVIGRLGLYDYTRVTEEDIKSSSFSGEDNRIVTDRARGNAVLDHLVHGEAVRHQDILIGNFLDSYHNLTIKHELGIRWVTENCPEVPLILKADDDAFIDLYGLLGFLSRTLGTDAPESVLACDVVPEGTNPQRSGKWAVSLEEYPLDSYPQYCSGLAYIMSMDVAKVLGSRARTKDWLWVDDVWVTGVLAQNLNVTYIFMNARYCYDQAPLDSWLARAAPASPPPCMVAHLNPSDTRYSDSIRKLWAHAALPAR